MEAPIQAYRDFALKVNRGSSEITTLCAIMQVSKTIMLQRFYLDELLSLSKGTDGVVGLVEVGGTNEKMHNITTRGGVLRLHNNGKTYRALNDAGLNTLGVANYNSVRNQHGYGVIIRVYVKSAFYVDTNNISVKWKKTSASVYEENYANGGLANQEEGYFEVLLSSPNIVISGNENIDLFVLNHNNEGIYTSGDYVVFVPAPSNRFGYGNYGSVAYADYDPLISPNYYFSTNYIEIGMEMYRDENKTQNVFSGYYANDTIWIKIETVGGKSVATKIGTVGSWDSGDPATPIRFVSRAFIGSATNWSTGCIRIESLTPVTIYYDNVDMVYRLGAFATASLATGFYYTGTVSANSSQEFIYINNGITNDYHYNCTNGYTPLPD